METVKGNSHVWLKFKIITTDNETIVHQIRISYVLYKAVARNAKILAIESTTSNEINKEIFIELLAYSSKLSQIFLKYDTH